MFLSMITEQTAKDVTYCYARSDSVPQDRCKNKCKTSIRSWMNLVLVLFFRNETNLSPIGLFHFLLKVKLPVPQGEISFSLK